MDALPATIPEDVPAEAEGWQLKTLTQKHKDVCSLVAQGLKRGEVAQICDITPEYVTMLMKQPLCLAFMQDLNAYAAAQLEAAFSKSVETIVQVMETGNDQDRLKAARLQLEATKRIGRPDPSAGHGAGGSEERLLALSERLTSLLAKARGQAENNQEIEDENFGTLPGSCKSGKTNKQKPVRINEGKPGKGRDLLKPFAGAVLLK